MKLIQFMNCMSTTLNSPKMRNIFNGIWIRKGSGCSLSRCALMCGFVVVVVVAQKSLDHHNQCHACVANMIRSCCIFVDFVCKVVKCNVLGKNENQRFFNIEMQRIIMMGCSK